MFVLNGGTTMCDLLQIWSAGALLARTMTQLKMDTDMVLTGVRLLACWFTADRSTGYILKSATCDGCLLSIMDTLMVMLTRVLPTLALHSIVPHQWQTNHLAEL